MKKLLGLNAILIVILISTSLVKYEEVEETQVIAEVQIEQETEYKVEGHKEMVQVTSRGGTTIRKEGKTYSNYQITSYHPGDGYGSGTRTGSGKSISDFDTMMIGNKKVYTYKGKIVVATATEELYNTGYSLRNAQKRQEGKHYFRYYDELQINIDGTYYDAIVLDSCGASMWEGEFRVDIYVPTSSDIINRRNVDIIV